MSTMTLKGAKGEGDFFRLRFWGAVLLVLGALLALGAFPAHAAPLAGTAIGNQASASYTDANAVARITVSNSVSTIVQAVGSANLVQSQTKVGAPGQTLSFPHSISNTGNSADTYAVTIGTVVNAATFNPTPSNANIFGDANCDGQADNNTVITSVGPVAPGAQGCFVVQVTLAASGAAASFPVNYNSGIVGATLQANSVAGSSVTDSVSISNNAVINVTKSTSATTGPSGTVVVYQLTYRNTGTVSAGNVVISDQLPSGASFVPGSGRWGAATGTVLTNSATDTDAGSAGVSPYRLDFSTVGSTVVAILERVDPGVQGIIEFQATLSSATAPVTINNQAQWCYSDIGTGGSTVPAAVAAACTPVQLTAQWNTGGTPLAGDLTTLTSTTNTNQSNIVPFFIPAVGATGVAKINDGVQGTAVSVDSNPANTTASTLLNDDNSDVAVATAGQGTLATWDTTVWNTTPSVDTYNISVTSSTGAAPNFPAGTTFLLFRSDGFTPLTDSNNDGVLDTGPVSGSGSYVVRARIRGSQVDLQNRGGTTTGAGQEAAGATGPHTTVSINPGNVATFGLNVVNTGAVADSFDLSYNVGNGAYTTANAFTTPGALPVGFALKFYQDNGSTCASLGAEINNTGVIAVGATRQVCAVVSVPSGSAANTFNLFFRALSPTTWATGDFTTSSADVKQDRLIVLTLLSVAITPNNSGQGFPGGSVQYCHTITNSGNSTESSLVVTQSNQSLNGTSGWGQYATFYLDTNNNCVLDGVESSSPATISANVTALAAGATRNIIVVVQVPGAAAAGQTNVSTFTLSGSTGITTAVVNDTTNVVLGQISLVKDQVLDATCANLMTSNAGGTGSLDTLTYVQTQLSAPPGACIIYRVRATNVGTQSVTAVTINDVAPPNTIINLIGAPATATVVGNAVAGAMTSGTVCAANTSAPNVSCTVAGTLPGGSTTTMYFRVRINP